MKKFASVIIAVVTLVLCFTLSVHEECLISSHWDGIMFSVG